MKPFILTAQNQPRIFWNLDANVGSRSPNKREDVHLVQFAYSVMATNPQTPQQNKPIFAAVKVGVECTGRDDDPLVIAIRAHQRSRGGVQDGHVSVIAGSGGYDSHNTFMMVALNNNLFDAVPNDFPRIDKHPSCPPLVQDAVRRCCRH